MTYAYPTCSMPGIPAQLSQLLVTLMVTIGMLAPCPCDACDPLENHSVTDSDQEPSEPDGCCPGSDEGEREPANDVPADDHVCSHCGSDTFADLRATIDAPDALKLKNAAPPATSDAQLQGWQLATNLWSRVGVMRANPPPEPTADFAPETNQRIATLQSYLC